MVDPLRAPEVALVADLDPVPVHDVAAHVAAGARGRLVARLAVRLPARHVVSGTRDTS